MSYFLSNSHLSLRTVEKRNPFFHSTEASVRKLLLIYLMVFENPIPRRGKQNSARPVYEHCHIRPPYYYVSYAVGRIGIEPEVHDL